MNRIIECVPNFSEGQNQETILAIANAIKSIEGVQLLHCDSGKAANRTVYTFAGELTAVFEAAFLAIKVASECIDMQQQKGEHPRIGACDVCPFVPISGITVEELIPYVEKFGESIQQELQIPVFFYEASAKSDKRKNLANHRIGNYEALQHRMESGNWPADLGNTFNPKTGGCIIGARNFLVAYNINLISKDANLAMEIAYNLRTLGRPYKSLENITQFKPGKLKAVKAIGWYIEDFQIAQVSINLIDFNTTPLHVVFETTKEIAKNYHTEVTGSELIGLIPKQAIVEAGKYYHSNSEQATEVELIQSAIQGLGLDDLKDFDANKRVLEHVLYQYNH